MATIPGQLHLWFLWTLFVIQIVFLATRPLVQDGTYPMPVLVLLGLLIVSILIALPDRSDALNHWAGNAVRYMPRFILGLIVGQWSGLVRIKTVYRVGAAVVFAAILAIWRDACD